MYRSSSLYLLTVVLFISSCSIFKKTTSHTDTDQQVVRNNNVLTKTLENIKLTVPAEVFAELYGAKVDYDDLPDTTKEAKPKTPPKPVVIEINRQTEQKDSSTTTTKTTQQTKVVQENKTESKGWFSFSAGFIIAIVAAGALTIYIVIK